MHSKRWSVAPPTPLSHLRKYKGISPVLAQVLFNRGFEDPQEAYRFLYTKDHAGDPFRMKGMSKAVGRLRHAIRQKEPIIVYGDFDADGVTSTVLLVQVLKALNANVKPYIPHRIDEGYGLNSTALRRLAQAGVKVVITVDCGIRSVDEVADGNAAGLDIIITDHHSVGPEIPNAYAVVNPKQEDCKYTESMLAGVGVAFKVAQALLKADQANGGRTRSQPALAVDNLLDLVAIGTVADLMPLNRLENRALVRQGLQVLNRAQRPGVQALFEVSGLKPGGISTTSIGFAVGPRINAAGRLESAMIAYDLLASETLEEAMRWAEKLQELNIRRQDLTRAAQETIRQHLEEEISEDLPLIFTGDSSFLPGIVGLVAGRVAEEYFRPAVIMEYGETESRASCRSIPQFDITSALDRCADLLVRHGGHALAAGFTVLNENIPALKSRLLHIAEESLSGQDLSPTLYIDVEVDVHQLNEELVTDLQLLEPCGHDNPSPTLMSLNARILEYRTVGKDEQHLKLKVARAGMPPIDAIGFGLGAWVSHMPERVDLAYQLEMNEWNGRRAVQMNLQDIRVSQT